MQAPKKPKQPRAPAGLGDPQPRPMQTDLVWPAIPPAADAQILGLLFQLDRTQWWPPERLRAKQFEQLSHLVPYAAKHAPAYKKRLAGLADIGPGELSEAAFRAIPVLTRDQAKRAGKRLRSTALPPSHGKTVEGSTSGSSGTPFHFTRTIADVLMSKALAQRGALWHDWDMTQTRLAVGRVEQGGEGPRQQWVPFLQTGPAYSVDIRRPADEILAKIIEVGPAYLTLWPSLLTELLRLSIETGLYPDGLRAVSTYGEAVPVGLAGLCQEVWGATLQDGYSCEEIGPMAMQCPHGAYHVHAEHTLVEILDDDGRECGPGETGRVVVTSLHNFATPMIRMELGDLATVGEPCVCGRGLPVLTRIDGRVRDLLTLPDGRRVLPTFDEHAITHAAPGLLQYQLRQEADGSVTVLYKSDRALSAKAQSAMGKALATGIGHEFDFGFERVESEMRTPAAKHKRWIEA